VRVGVSQLDLFCGGCDRCEVLVIPLALADKYAIAVRKRGGEYMAASRHEVEQAGYPLIGHVMTKVEGKMVSCAMTGPCCQCG
jgi:hypothetical protein